jgi:hypothetical protein
VLPLFILIDILPKYSNDQESGVLIIKSFIVGVVVLKPLPYIVKDPPLLKLPEALLEDAVTDFKLMFGVFLNQLLAEDRSEIKFVPILVIKGLLKLPDQLDRYDAISCSL